MLAAVEASGGGGILLSFTFVRRSAMTPRLPAGVKRLHRSLMPLPGPAGGRRYFVIVL